MSESRLRMKIGEHELEVEGATEFVERHAAAFKRLVSVTSGQPQLAAEEIAWDRFMRQRGRILSLSAQTKVEDAVLLLLLGHRHLRKNDNVTGSEIMSGLRDSGIDVPRADTVLLRHARVGNILVNGRRRSRKYRLSDSGVERAREIARTLTSRV